MSRVMVWTSFSNRRKRSVTGALWGARQRRIHRRRQGASRRQSCDRRRPTGGCPVLGREPHEARNLVDAATGTTRGKDHFRKTHTTHKVVDVRSIAGGGFSAKQ